MMISITSHPRFRRTEHKTELLIAARNSSDTYDGSCDDKPIKKIKWAYLICDDGLLNFLGDFFFSLITKALKRILTFFFVFSSKDLDARFFYIDAKLNNIDEHLSRLNSAELNKELESEIGFEARPQLKRCKDCPLFDSCKRKTTIPTIENVTLILKLK